jgi:hypothetical protein
MAANGLRSPVNPKGVISSAQRLIIGCMGGEGANLPPKKRPQKKGKKNKYEKKKRLTNSCHTNGDQRAFLNPGHITKT